MGALLAKFRKEQTTEKKLENLEEKIQKIEEYTVNTQERKKRFVGTFLAVAVGIYVIAVISIVYYVYFPRTWKERCLYFVPLLIFPYVIILLRRLFTWYFQRKLNKNANTLTELRAEKKKILEQVMDKETYKVAVNLLARFAEKGTSTSNSRLSLGSMQRSNPSHTSSSSTLRTIARPTGSQLLSSPLQANRNSPLRPTAMGTTSQNLALTPHLRVDQQLRRRTPFPIINQAEKSIFERCLDLIIGDGPQDRFAIICKECHSHNGMALREEFDYIAYRCAFCNAMNPARKTRPIAPRISLQGPSADSFTPRSISRSGDSSNSTPSPESSDDDESESPTRRIQLRLTESTANQSESPEVINHDVIAAVEEPSPEIAAETETKAEAEPVPEPEPMELGNDDSLSNENTNALKKAN